VIGGLFIYTVGCCFRAVGNKKELFQNVGVPLKGWSVID